MKLCDRKNYEEAQLIASGTKAMNTTFDNTAATLNGDGTVTLASTAHGFAANSMLFFASLSYYNGLQTASAVAANSITIAVDSEQAFTPAGTETITVTLYPQTAFCFLEARLKLNTAPTTDENFTMTLDSGHGSSYDVVLDTVPVLGDTSFHRVATRNDGFSFRHDDKLVFGWTNTDGRTWGLEVIYGYLKGV